MSLLKVTSTSTIRFKHVLDLLPQTTSSIPNPVRSNFDFRGCECSRKTELAWNTLYTMSRVDVFDKSDLEAGCRTLTRDNGRVGEEKLPNLRQIKNRNFACLPCMDIP